MKKGDYCGVPQCKNYSNENISMHNIPKSVLKDNVLKKKWMHILRMGKPFPKRFKICSEHFKSKYLLARLHKGNKRKYVHISANAFPTEKLPKSSVETKSCKSRKPPLCRDLNSINIESTYLSNDVLQDSDYENLEVFNIEEPSHLDKNIQCMISLDLAEKNVEPEVKPETTFITSLWNTDKKLRIMTGIPSEAILNQLVKNCERVYKIPHRMSMKNRILLTMCKLKNNDTFAVLCTNFDITFNTAKEYFSETIQLLSQILSGVIYWPTREQNLKRLPKCFKKYPNVMTVLDCTEVKTVQFGCLDCRASTYSHYKCQHTVKILIGVTPSGLINYVSPAVAGRASDKTLFAKTNLLDKLKPGDAVMVDKGFLIGNELEEAGIEMIRPDFAFERLTKTEVNRSTEIASARVHVERLIGRIKTFKILSDKVPASVLPYIDDVITVICAISNLSEPLFGDDKFLKQSFKENVFFSVLLFI